MIYGLYRGQHRKHAAISRKFRGKDVKGGTTSPETEIEHVLCAIPKLSTLSGKYDYLEAN